LSKNIKTVQMIDGGERMFYNVECSINYYG